MAAPHLDVFVLSWHRFNHLLDCSCQVFGILFNRKFRVSKTQHAAAASGDVQQRALFGALHLQLQIFFGALQYEISGWCAGEGAHMVEVGKAGTYINHNGLLLFLKENGANKVRKHANLSLHEKILHTSWKRAQVARGMGKWLGRAKQRKRAEQTHNAIVGKE
jgi:hypothetical protein